jgi:hypothetical protein
MGLTSCPFRYVLHGHLTQLVLLLHLRQAAPGSSHPSPSLPYTVSPEQQEIRSRRQQQQHIPKSTQPVDPNRTQCRCPVLLRKLYPASNAHRCHKHRVNDWVPVSIHSVSLRNAHTQSCSTNDVGSCHQTPVLSACGCGTSPIHLGQP